MRPRNSMNRCVRLTKSMLLMQKFLRIKLLLRTLAHFYPSSYPGRGVSRNVRRLPPESALFNNLQKNNSWGWGCISAKNTGRTNRNIFCLLRVVISHSPHVPLCVNSVLKKNSFLHIISIGQFVVYLHCFWEWVLQLWLDYLAGENNVFWMFTDPSVGPQFRFVAFFDAAFVSGASFWANRFVKENENYHLQNFLFYLLSANLSTLATILFFA